MSEKTATHTPGPWQIWEGPQYVGGAADLCIGAGPTWLANMDHRCCQNYAHHIGCHEDGCKLEGDANVCTIDSNITNEQRANAQLISAAPDLYAAVKAFLDTDDTDPDCDQKKLTAMLQMVEAIKKAEGR